MSYAKVKQEIARKLRATHKLPPRKPAPADAKAQLERIKAEIAARKKDQE